MRRRDQFADQYLQPLLAEARKLGIGPEELKKMIDRLGEMRHDRGGHRARREQALRGCARSTRSASPLTIFDEPHLGLDAVARQIFYDRLLADYAAHSHTVVLSTHLIDEVGDLIEQVMLLDRSHWCWTRRRMCCAARWSRDTRLEPNEQRGWRVS
jgi:ABC-type Na+ transport system ATPase subunit NatA